VTIGDKINIQLYADTNAGEGFVIFPNDWFDNDPILQADLLKDWIAGLTEAYNDAVEAIAV